jgi:hypothetical protein
LNLKFSYNYSDGVKTTCNANSYMKRDHLPLYPLGTFKQFVPRKSCLHRQAAIALYRALITKCRSSPFSCTEREHLQQIVRNRFVANRDIVSTRLLKISFQAGYKALDHLDGAVASDEQSITHVSNYLAQVPGKLKRPPPPPSPPRVEPPDHAEPPLEDKFLANFPRPTVDGIRKIPFWVHANGIAFVRYKKPQPYNLSRTLRQLMLQKANRIHVREELEDYHIPLAEYEDAWDGILYKNFGVVSGGERFAETVRECRDEVYKAIRERDTQFRKTAKVMFAVVEGERELALEEREDRRRIAWEKRQARKLEKGVPSGQERPLIRKKSHTDST